MHLIHYLLLTVRQIALMHEPDVVCVYAGSTVSRILKHVLFHLARILTHGTWVEHQERVSEERTDIWLSIKSEIWTQKTAEWGHCYRGLVLVVFRSVLGVLPASHVSEYPAWSRHIYLSRRLLGTNIGIACDDKIASILFAQFAVVYLTKYFIYSVEGDVINSESKYLPHNV